MTKVYIIIASLMFLVTPFINGQNSEFLLRDIHYQSDINYSAISKIDDCSLENLIDSVFNIQEGKFTIYRFERISTIDTKDNLRTKENKEIIITKVLGNKILEAYYCPLSWREPPISHVVLVSQKKVRLSKEVSVKRLKFKNLTQGGLVLLNDAVIVFGAHAKCSW
jgi:hypothetical protein